MKKNILLCLVLVIILILPIFLVYAVTEKQVKTVLRRSLFEYFKNPKNMTLEREEILLLLEVYFAEEGIENINLGEVRTNTGRSVESIVNDAIKKWEGCTEGWKCKTSSYKAYQTISCEWKSITFCNYGCSNGSCLKPEICQNECTPAGITKCEGNYKKTCGNYDNSDSCLEWGAATLCANGCSNGACLAERNETQCTDTDPNNDIFIRGVCSDGGGEFHDSCNNGYGRQYYCMQGKCEPMSMICPSQICQNNACVQLKNCFEQNGDICTENEVCLGDEVIATERRCCSVPCKTPSWDNCEKCGSGLFNICDIEECNSISEGCYFTHGLVGGDCVSCFNVSCRDFLDYKTCEINNCLDCVLDGQACISPPNYVNCSTYGNYWCGTHYDWDGQCRGVGDIKNGTCYKGGDVYSFCMRCGVCNDTDGGRVYDKKGFVYGPELYNRNYASDYCDYNKLHEFYCGEGGKIHYEIIDCNICSDGACIQGDITNCTDSDGGENFYEYGEVTIGDIKYTDRCSTTIAANLSFTSNITIYKLTEFYCYLGDLATKNYTCPNKCSNGACIP